LTFAERAHFNAPNEDRPNCLACVDERDSQRGAITLLKRTAPTRRVFVYFGQHVRDLDRSSVDDRTPS